MSTSTFHTLSTSISLVLTITLSYNLLFHSHTIYKYVHSFLSYPYFSCSLLIDLTAWPSTKHFLNCTNRTVLSLYLTVPFILLFFLLWIYLTKLCSWATLFQRTLLGTAFLCWCLGDFGELSGGGHCGLVSWMSSSILKAFFGGLACGGQTTDILLQCGLLSSHVFVISFSPLCVLSTELRLLMEYLHSSFSSEGIGPALPAGGFCPSPLS